jgi:FMN phosphatase YigB (HAD superfamily)
VAPTTIEAILFDFGQTLVDSADGFRAAEKKTQDRLAENLKIARRDEFLGVYRWMRREFQDRSDYSRRTPGCARSGLNTTPFAETGRRWRPPCP